MSCAIYLRIYLLSGTVIQAIGYNNSLISPFRHVTVSNTTVYISGEGGIVSLHRKNLSEININTTYKNNWLLLHDNSEVIQCNADIANISYCRKLKSDLSDVTESGINMTVNITSLPVYTTTHIPQNNKEVFVVGTTILKYLKNSYGIASFFSDNLSRGPVNIETGGKFRLNFKSSFVNKQFVYFLFQEWDEDGEFISSRLGRICINTGDTNKYHSYEDIKITCIHNGTTYNKVQYAIGTEEYILVAFAEGSGSLICAFKQENILEKYNNSMESALMCESDSPVKRYFDRETTLKSGNIKYCFKNGRLCDSVTNTCNDTYRIFCDTEYNYTIIGVETMEDGIPVRAVEKFVTKLDVFNSSDIFIGTNDGQIGKIPFIPYNMSDGRPIQFYSIDSSSVLQIVAEDDDLQVMTQNKYHVIHLDNCSMSTTCTSCLLNPKCSWSYNYSRCDSAETDSEWWVSSQDGFCIEITDFKSKILPSDLYSISFSLITPSNVKLDIESKGKATCGVDTKTGQVVKDDEKFVCVVSDMTYTATGNYTFWINHKSYGRIAEKNVEIINCREFNTCKECVKTQICRFHKKNFKCGPSGIQNEDKCPKLRYISPTRIPVSNSTINISADVSIIPDEDLASFLQCEMNMKNYSVSLGNETLISCIGLPTNVEGNFTIRIKYEGFYLYDGFGILEVYNCSTLLRDQDCGKCVNLKDYGYNCTWCIAETNCYNPYEETCRGPTSPVVCDISVKEISPASGPVKGGTLLTITGTGLGTIDYNVSVFIHETRCDVYEVVDYHKLYCVTGEVNSSITNSLITIIAYNQSFTFSEGPYFTYKELQEIQDVDFQPRNGTLSGGKTITISGPNIGFTGINRYAISFCNDIECIDCSTLDYSTTFNQTKCKTGNSSTEQTMTYLSIQIDTNTKINITRPFYYLPDPIINLPNETKAQEGGGSTFNIKGEGFNNVGEITVDRVEEKCKVPNDTTAVCKTPEFEGGSPNQTVNVHFDGITTQITIYYVPNPRFEKFGGILDYDDPEAAIRIRGHDILNGAKKEDYKVDIGMDGKCLINTITMTAINCYPPKNVPRTNYTDPDVVYVIIEGGNLRTYIGDLRYGEKKNYLVIVVGVLAAALVATVVIGVITVLTLKKKKRKAIKAFKMELLSREEMIRKASREEFAEAQMTIRDIKSDLVTTKVPYCDYQQYVFHILFPNQDIKTHPLLLASRVTDDSKIKMQKAMEMLDKLLTNKKFLESLVQTLDRLNKLTMQEKAHFASLLSIALTGNMRLFFNLVNSLLIETIHSGSKRQNKVLFRRFESISQRLMAHWLQIVLYTQLKTQSGLQLFMLYRAVQTVIEKAPVDALTSNSRNTLAEEKLLKMRVEFDSLTLQIDLNGNSDQHYPVKVLDCDTISQVKQKCVEQIYKNRPASDIPHNDELSLEWRIGKGGKHILEDEDTISDRNNGLVRLNTLKHYMVKDNSQMALMYKEHIVEDVYENQSHQLESVTSDDINLVVPGEGDEQAGNTLKWHLESCASNLPDDEKSNREQDIGDIFLNRLFHTKLLLSDYIEIAFEGLMDPQSLSVPIRYFLCMLDKLGKENDIEPDVIQIWKSECYATRLWGPLIGKPQIIFDVDVPAHVEPCMDILKQVFVECFTQTAHKVNKESPPQKLLFHKDIPQYRKRIEPFFIRVEPVDDQTFWGALDEISTSQKNEMKFSRQATLQQLYNLFIAKYSTEIIDDFLDMEESKDLGFGNKLEEVIELMEESATD